MKTKTKKVSKKKNEVHYPAYYLAVALAGVLILEGLLLGAASPESWEKGMEVLDLSSAVQEVGSDLAVVMDPMVQQVSYVHMFYQLAATEMIAMFDFSDQDVLIFPKGVMEFYRLASIEMAKLLDFSDQFAYWPQVAGASVFR